LKTCSLLSACIVATAIACTDDPAPADDMGEDTSGAADMAAQAEDMPRDEGSGPIQDMGQDMPPADMDAPDMDAPDMDASDMEPEDMGQDMSMEDMPEDMAEDMGMEDMDPGPVVGADTCAMARDVTGGGTFPDQTTLGLTDDYEASASENGCPNGRISGPDAAYVVTPMMTTRYRVTVTPEDGSFDPLLYARTACTDVVCLAGTVFSGPGDPENIEFEVAGGQSAFIIVDGEILSSGRYTLDVQVIPLP